MLEAVNSVLQSAPVVRQAVERTSVSESFAANPEGVQRIATAPYISPFIVLDLNHNAAVIAFRNRDTGDVIQQVPSESSLEAKRRELAREAQPAIHTPKPDAQKESELQFVQSTVPAKQTVSTPSPQPEISQSSAPSAATAQQLAAFDAGANAAAPSTTGSQVSVVA